MAGGVVARLPRPAARRAGGGHDVLRRRRAPGCEARATAAQAFADADADGDRIELGAVTATSALANDRAITVVGAGEAVTDLRGGLTLSDPRAALSGATVHGLELTGIASGVRIEGLAELRGDAALRAATVRGDRGVDAADGTPRSSPSCSTSPAGRACASAAARRCRRATSRSSAGPTPRSRRCARARRRTVRDSILWGPPGTGFAGPGRGGHRPLGLPRRRGARRPARATARSSRASRPAARGSRRLAADRRRLAGVRWRRRSGRRTAPGSRGSPTATATAWPPAIPARSSSRRPPVPLPAGNLLGDPGRRGRRRAGPERQLRARALRRRSRSRRPRPGCAGRAASAFFAGGPGVAGERRGRRSTSTRSRRRSTSARRPRRCPACSADTARRRPRRRRAPRSCDPAGGPLGSGRARHAGRRRARERHHAAARARAPSPIPPLTRSIEVTLRATCATGSATPTPTSTTSRSRSRRRAPRRPVAPAAARKPFAGRAGAHREGDARTAGAGCAIRRRVRERAPSAAARASSRSPAR